MIKLAEMLSEFSMLFIVLCLACDIVNRQSAYFFIGVAVFYYQCSSSGCLVSLNFSQLCILQLAIQLNIFAFAVSYIKSDFAVCTDAAAVNELILRFNGLNQLLLIKRYSVSMVAALVRIRRFSNSYITILVSSNGSNSVGINNIFQLTGYPTAGCYIFYNRLNVIACRIINL